MGNSHGFVRLCFVVSILTMFGSRAVAGSLIEGGTEHALRENAGLLKSYIQLNMGPYFHGGLCSGSLVAPNIILTAQHCVKNLKAGDPIGLNGDPSYEVVEALSPPQPSIPFSTFNFDSVTHALSVIKFRYNIDVGLILVRSTDYMHSKLKELKTIPIANPEQISSLSNRVLLAGFGESVDEKGDSGKLRAGYNTALTGGLKGPVNEKLKATVNSIRGKIGISNDGINLASLRKRSFYYDNKRGNKMSFDIEANPEVFPENSAQPKHGDSGGPMVAFDAVGNPFIVGVVSCGLSQAMTIKRMISITDGNGKLYKAFEGENSIYDALVSSRMNPEITKVADHYFESQNELMLLELEKGGFIDMNQNVLKNFKLTYSYFRLAVDDYAAVTSEMNYPMITGLIKSLGKDRDEKWLAPIGLNVQLTKDDVKPNRSWLSMAQSLLGM